MQLLVIGSGGREHALVWKLAQSPYVDRIWCAPGNPGIGEERCTKTGDLVDCLAIGAEEVSRLLTFAREKHPTLTIVGPDNPLALGIVDRFQQQGLRIWGPDQKAAQLESSKAFAQAFMARYGIPTAAAGVFSDATPAKAFAATLGGKCAVKADGLAFGKGVLLCSNETETHAAIDQILRSRAFGAAGERIVVQELLEGPEISLHALCDGKTAHLFPSAQDHKRVFDGDHGPNTGGMGAYCPTPFLSDRQLTEIEKQLLGPWQAGCAAEGIDFRGLLYPGVFLTHTGPKVVEFNARFGDPEAQVYLPGLANDLVELLEASVDGRLDHVQLRWNPVFTVCVVMASEGYPSTPTKGKPIAGVATANALPNTKVFHAGTANVDGRLVTNGGRVLGVTAWSKTLQEAQTAAYAAVARIQFEGAHYRRDIAATALQPQEEFAPEQ
jgi:phosphoribosylamine---glycine ligase